MIQFVTGIPGSGKSYYGLFSIAINFNKTLQNNKKFKSFQLSKTKYKVALTNINEVKFDSFDNLKPLNWDDFKSIISKLYHQKIVLDKSDTELEQFVKDEDFYYSLIVLDECHNYLNKDDEVLVWWLSYHRHFFQDIILITQDLPLVNKKYKAFSEFYYKAIPASRKLFNTQMIYQQYTAASMFKTQLALTKKLPILKEVFELYGSGENNKQKSLVKHFLLLALLIFIIVLTAGTIYLKNFFGGGAVEQKSIKSPQEQQLVTYSNKKNIEPNDSGDFYEMYCNFSYCFINSNIYEKKFVLELLKNDYKAKIIAKSKYKFYFQSQDKFNLFQKKSKKEDIKNEENSILPGFNFNNK